MESDEEKANAFAGHLAQVFTTLPVNEKDIQSILVALCQLSLPTNCSPYEVPTYLPILKSTGLQPSN